MKKRFISAAFFLFVFVFLSAGDLFAGSFGDFLKDLRGALFSVQGKGKVFGYTAEHVFAEIKEGSFRPGDIVIVKGAPDLGVQVPDSLYDDVAFGEIEQVRDSIAKIYVLRKFKAIPREALVVGLKKLYVNLAGNGDISELYPLFLHEKDIYLQEKPDDKTNIKIFFDARKEGVFGYRVVSSAGRIILLGSITLQGGAGTTAPAKAGKGPNAEASLPLNIAFNENNGDYWLFKEGAVFCHTCGESRAVRIGLEGVPANMFFESGSLVIWEGNGKTRVIGEKGEEKSYDGYLTQGDPALFDLTAKKLYDIKKTQIIAGDIGNLSGVYYLKDGSFLGRENNRLVTMEGKKIAGELPLRETDIIRVKGDRLYVFTEKREDVPLAGEYITLLVDVFDIKTLKLQMSVEVNDVFVAFDVDGKNGELIYVRKDGTIKRMKL